MGKKGRKKEESKFPGGGLRAEVHRFQDESKVESFQKMAEMDLLTLQEQKDAIRQVLVDMGTDVSRYDEDPTGDGDQAPIETERQREAGRELYSIGGDIHVHLTQNAISPFAMMCSMGCVEAVERAIRDLTKIERKPHSTNGRMMKLVETRETSLRLSPLLLIVSAGKNAPAPVKGMQKHGETARVLLKYGASPVAKDVLGKTVCHYGAGMMATNMTLEVVDMCIQAAKTHYLYGKQVLLHGLSATQMNGRVGVAGGFDCNAVRRSVYLPEEDREVWIKTENMKLTSSGNRREPLILSDVQDRFGSVSLHEVIMTDRVDVAEFLLRKHETSIHTADMDGISPLQQVSGMGQLAFKASHVVMDVAKEEGKRTTKERKDAEEERGRRCAMCDEELDVDKRHLCSRCKATSYCGRDCQVAHWKRHKKDCKEMCALSSGVKLAPPSEMREERHSASTSFITGSVHSNGAYQKPRKVDDETKFVVKVQAMGGRSPILVYDETRTCEFDIKYGQAGFDEILAETRKEMAWEGRKTFMKASFDRSGTCTLYPGKAGTKSHYTW